MSTNTLDVLLVGQNPNLIRALPKLFHRAGFYVDVITTSNNFRRRPFLRQLTEVSDINALVKQCSNTITKKQKKPYTLVVICDDKTLYEILSSELPTNIKKALLPVCEEKDFKHLYSKIGLSFVLSTANIRTPKFIIAENYEALSNILNLTTKPLFLKIDRSGGGNGVFEINKDLSLNNLNTKKLIFPILVQEKIEGEVIDVSGFYQNGKLIYFTYSKFEDMTANQFGPSWLRTYTQLAKVPQLLLNELENIGRALGANGFINMSCIKSSEDNMHYFFEADMRPTVWITYGQYLGDDPAFAIKKYFLNGKNLEKLPPLNKKFPENLLIPYIFRMKKWQILCNKHNVLNYYNDFTKLDILIFFWQGLVSSIKKYVVLHIKPHINEKIWKIITRF